MSKESQAYVQKYDLLGCIQCGKCTGGCPAAIRTKLNVRRFIYDCYNDGLWEELSRFPEVWDCVGCHVCAVRCPKGLKPLEVLYALRNQIIEKGKVTPAVRDALESVFLEGNPWSKPRATRLDWMKELGLAPKTVREGEQVDYLFFVCCSIAYDPRLRVIVRSLAKLMEQVGLSYSFLGEEESCCGNEVEALGEKELFEELCEQNTKLLKKYPAKKIVAVSPHCLSALEKYPELDTEVLHYTQLLSKLIQEDGLAFNGSFSKKVVFHDPCHLGKKKGILDEPRRVLKEVSGLKLLEFRQSRERSLCCEGGGGKMWMETSSQEERLAETRVKNAKELGAEVISTACPFCVLTLEDAVKSTYLEEKIKVMEITEILGMVSSS